ncbi:Peptidoglycan-binding domain 1 protein [Alloactinosynnema sp. L-07]|nr:Peptidoglycan-binding domain 1 protein [Alloactinosynnema sp. L-07]
MGDVMTSNEQAARAVKPGRQARAALGLIAALSVALGAAGLVAAARIKSPSQALAEAQPPPAGPVTAPVEHRVMQDSVVLRGMVGAERAVRVRAPGAVEGSRALITRVPVAVGDTVTAGTVIAEVSGRPVIVLTGAVPAYRDLAPGSEGADVAQLQHALRAMGHSIGRDKEGMYGPGTKLAVTALYRAVGYSPAAPARTTISSCTSPNARSAMPSGHSPPLRARQGMAMRGNEWPTRSRTSTPCGPKRVRPCPRARWRSSRPCPPPFRICPRPQDRRRPRCCAPSQAATWSCERCSTPTRHARFDRVNPSTSSPRFSDRRLAAPSPRSRPALTPSSRNCPNRTRSVRTPRPRSRNYQAAPNWS